jgi:hypothetical protein
LLSVITKNDCSFGATRGFKYFVFSTQHVLCAIEHMIAPKYSELHPNAHRREFFAWTPR